MKRIFKLIILNTFVLAFLFCCLIKSNAAYLEKYLNKDFAPNYYDGLNLNQDSESFKQDLSVIISTGYVHKGYSELATLYKTSDIDPNDSTKVLCLYTKNPLDNTSAAVGGWDREHVWAKSHGFPAGQSYTENGIEIKYEDTDPYTDAHHLRPATAIINRTRSDFDFGELDETAVLNYEDEFGNKICKETRTFEPADHCKGDVARMLLYMDTRYGFTYPFNLKLVDDAHTTGTNGNGRVGNLQTLLKWHYEDPVDTSEIYRNNVIYDTWQHNRNPYIDHPEYVSIAYPNQYDSGSIDKNKVNAVISLIDALPSVITLDQETAVNGALNAYNELNDAEKNLITNVDVLTNAEATIKLLKMSNFVQLKTMSSFIVTYNNGLNPTDVDLRFGGRISSSMYDENAHYGVLVTRDYQDEIVSGKYSSQGITDFLNTHSGYQKMECVPVRVNAQGELDESGEYYQFAWVINDMENQYSTMLKGILYMEYNGDLYLSNMTCYSVETLAKYYYDHQTELGLTQEQVTVVSKLLPHVVGEQLPGDTVKDFWS